MNQQSDIPLPPLPQFPDATRYPGECHDEYSAEEMHAYALAARAELEAKLESVRGILQHELAENALFRERAEAAEAEIERLKSESRMEWKMAGDDFGKLFSNLTTRAEAAEAEVLRLRTGFQTATVDLVAAEARIKDLEQSAEVAARNMRDLVAEHVRERGALQNRLVISERECEWWCLRYNLKLGPSEWNAAVNDFADDKELDGRQDLPT